MRGTYRNFGGAFLSPKELFLFLFTQGLIRASPLTLDTSQSLHKKERLDFAPTQNLTVLTIVGSAPSIARLAPRKLRSGSEVR